MSAEIFGDFYIEYEASEHDGMVISLDANVWHNAQRGGEPLFTLLTKWDGCSHMRMPYLHFDGLEAFEDIVKCVAYLYNDVCARVGMDET